MFEEIPHFDNIFAGGKLREHIDLLPQKPRAGRTIRLNGIHGVIPVIVRGVMIVDGQLAGCLQIQIIDGVLHLAGSTGGGDGDGAVGPIGSLHIVNDNPLELHGENNGLGGNVSGIDIANVQGIRACVQSGELALCAPLGILIWSRRFFPGHRQQGDLIVAGNFTCGDGSSSVIGTAGDPAQVDGNLAVMVGSVDRLPLFIRSGLLRHLGDGDGALRQKNGEWLNFHFAAGAAVSGFICCGEDITAAMGQVEAAGEAVTSLVGFKQFKAIEFDVGDLGHLVAAAGEFFGGIEECRAVGIFAERHHRRVGVPLIQVYKAVAGDAGALVPHCGAIDAPEHGIELNIRLHVFAGYEGLGGGRFGVIILILADGGLDRGIRSASHLEHDLHITGNGGRDRISIRCCQLGGNVRGAGVRIHWLCGAEPVRRQVARGGVARRIGDNEAVAAVPCDRQWQGPQLVAVLLQLIRDIRTVHRDGNQPAQIGKVCRQIQCSTLLDGCALGQGAAPVNAGSGGVALDIQRLGESLFQLVKTDLAALCPDGDRMRNGFLVVKGDGHRDCAVCRGIRFCAEAGEITAHFNLDRGGGIRPHEIEIDGIRQRLEGEVLVHIGHGQIASQGRGWHILRPDKGFFEVPCAAARFAAVAGCVIPGKDAVVLVDIQGHALAFDLITDIMEGVGCGVGHTDLAFSRHAGHDHNSALVHIVVEDTEISAAIIREFSHGDGGSRFGAGLHGQRQPQGGTHLCVDAADRGEQGIRLHAVEFYVVVGVVFRVFIAVGRIALDSNAQVQAASAIVGVVPVLGNREGAGDGAAIHGLNLAGLGGVLRLLAILRGAQQQIAVG